MKVEKTVEVDRESMEIDIKFMLVTQTHIMGHDHQPYN